jgi:hypothetical protein
MGRHEVKTSGISVPVDADTIVEQLKRIRKEYGCIDSKTFVDESRAASSPTHDCFTWDDSVAGERYRHFEARRIIRAVVIKGDDGEERAAFASVTVLDEDDNRHRTYLPVAEVVKDDRLLGSAVDHLIAKVDQLQASLEDLARTAESVGRKIDIKPTQKSVATTKRRLRALM